MKATVFKRQHATALIGLIVLLIMSFFFTACEKEMSKNIYRVYDDQMLDEMMEEEGLTSFLEIIDKAGFRGTVHAFGAYTLFAPTNEAVKTYLANLGMSDLDGLSADQAKDVIRYHLIANDTIMVSDFVDGRLRSRNFMKKFLTTKTQEDASIWVDRQATILTKTLTGLDDLHCANGILHIIDAVLTPPQHSVSDLISSLPDEEYSILKRFFDLSGLADTLAVENDNLWFTFFIQDNQAFTDAGITDETDLLKMLHENQRSTTKTDDELMRDYIGYHSVVNVMPKYVVDLLTTSSLQTLTPENKPILFERVGDRVWLDRLVTGKINEEGVQIDHDSDYTDLSCSNGVVHKILGNIQVKERSAYRVYWDMAEQPEIMALANFRKPGANKTFNPGELSEITWGGTYIATVTYQSFTMPLTEKAFDGKGQYVHADYLRFNLHPNTLKWIEFKLPVLMPGEYKVWVCYRRELDLQIKTTFKQEGREDQVMPYIFNMRDYMPAGTPEQQEILGWKQYNAKKYSSVVCSHILGTIKVEFEGRHILRLEPISSGRQGQLGNWDMFQFIPKDENQSFPRVDMLGNWVEEGTPSWAIFPYGTDPNADN